jgi:hypothetical protein
MPFPGERITDTERGLNTRTSLTTPSLEAEQPVFTVPRTLPAGRDLAPATQRLSAIYDTARAYNWLPLSGNALPGRADTAFYVILGVVYSTQINLGQRDRAYKADFDLVIPTIEAASLDWAVQTLSQHRDDMHELERQMTSPDVLTALMQAARSYFVEVGRQPAKYVALDLPLHLRPIDMPPDERIIIEDPAARRESERQALAVIDNSYLSLLYAHPERGAIFKALTGDVKQARRALHRLFAEVHAGIDKFESALLAEPNNVWRYSPIVVGGMTRLGFDDNVSLVRYTLEIARLKSAGEWDTFLLVAGVALAAAGLVVTGPAGWALLIADLAAAGMSTYDQYARARENDLAEAASVFRTGTPFTDRSISYAGAALEGAAALITALQLARGVLRLASRARGAAPPIAHLDAETVPGLTETAVEDRVASSSQRALEGRATTERRVATLDEEIPEATPIEEALERNAAPLDRLTTPRGMEERLVRPEALQRIRPPAKATRTEESLESLGYATKSQITRRPPRRLAGGRAARQRELRQRKRLEEAGIVPTRHVPVQLRKQRPITRPEQILGIPLDPIFRRRMRGRTPSPEIQKWAKQQLKLRDPDPALPGYFIDGPVEADHIVAMERIRQFDGFAELTEGNQVEVLNLLENFVPMSKRANASKQAKSFLEWEFHKKLGIKIDEAFRQRMIAEERRLVPIIQENIYELLRRQEQAFEAFQAGTAIEP